MYAIQVLDRGGSVGRVGRIEGWKAAEYLLSGNQLALACCRGRVQGPHCRRSRTIDICGDKSSVAQCAWLEIIINNADVAVCAHFACSDPHCAIIGEAVDAQSSPCRFVDVNGLRCPVNSWVP